MGDTTVQWSSYNKALMERGKVQFEFNAAFQEAWFEQEKGVNGQCYSDFAIQFCLNTRYQFNLTLRATQGFVETLFENSKLDLKVPNYTTLCRRQAKLSPTLDFSDGLKADQPRHIVVDSTGLKIDGE
jgi:hypothetical protein